MQYGKRILFLTLVIFSSAFLLAGCGKKKSEPTSAIQEVQVPVNTIEVSARPYVSLEPVANGRSITLVLHDLKTPAQSAEYELSYQSGSLLQGAFGVLNLEDLPFTKDILLGSCSAGGKCTFHEDVTGGELLLTFEADEEFALKNEWAYIENDDQETAFSSQDSKFRLEGEALAKVPYLIILQTPGLPQNPDRNVISAPYAVAASREVVGEVTVTMRTSVEAEKPQILGWSGQLWKELPTTSEGKMVTTTAPLYEAYVVVD